MTVNYKEFLKSKVTRFADSGFDLPESALNAKLFDFQKWIVRRALLKGKYAIFADCGLGKTLMQLEIAAQVIKITGKPFLILAPLGVMFQTIRQAAAFGYEIEKYSGQTESEIYIANYEQLEKIDTSIFGGVALDESSILKNFDGKTKKLIINKFALTPYKYALTATPSPNDPVELGNHAEFLNVMKADEMKAMYFVHDGGQTSKWYLKGHATKTFYRWVSEWACMLAKPSDIGFSDNGYVLPALNFIEKEIQTEKRGDKLFNDTAISATDFNRELRITKIERLSEVAEIVNDSDENFIVWVKQDEEADYLNPLIPDAMEVRGSMKSDLKEQRLLGFADNDFRVLITKSKIAQFGLNFQSSNNQIFPSLDFSFESLYQSIRRQWRFGQTKPVNIYIITTDTMQNVVQSIKQKQQEFETMQKAMTDAMTEIIYEPAKVLTNQTEYKSENAHIKLGDSVELIKEIPDESIGFSIFSPPFAELYTYSDDIADMGNSKDYREFFTAFNFLVKDLQRIMWQGRNVAVHCMDLPIQKGKEGFIGLRDFSGMIRESFEREGFIFHSKITIWKDPVTEMQRTKALGLLHKQVLKDAAMSRVGLPDYLLVFRKRGEHNHPVRCDIPVDLWQKYASPVWYDINYSKTLNKTEAREENDGKHICPLQLDTIERAIHLWTNEGDTVFTPFLGIGSEVFQALKMNRKGIGFELKKSYLETAIKNIRAAEQIQKQTGLFETIAA